MRSFRLHHFLQHSVVKVPLLGRPLLPVKTVYNLIITSYNLIITVFNLIITVDNLIVNAIPVCQFDRFWADLMRSFRFHNFLQLGVVKGPLLGRPFLPILTVYNPIITVYNLIITVHNLIINVYNLIITVYNLKITVYNLIGYVNVTDSGRPCAELPAPQFSRAPRRQGTGFRSSATPYNNRI